MYSCWGCLTAIVILTCSIILFSEMSTSAKEYDQMLANWDTDPIMDIRVVNGNSKCPSGFSDLFSY